MMAENPIEMFGKYLRGLDDLKDGYEEILADNERLQSEHQTLQDEYNSRSATAADMSATITDREAEIELLTEKLRDQEGEVERLNQLVYHLETNADPAGTVAELALTKDQNLQLQKEVERLKQ